MCHSGSILTSKTSVKKSPGRTVAGSAFTVNLVWTTEAGSCSPSCAQAGEAMRSAAKAIVQGFMGLPSIATGPDIRTHGYNVSFHSEDVSRTPCAVAYAVDRMELGVWS